MTWAAVQVITPPAVMALDLPQAKDRLRVDHPDEDAAITAMIRGAVARIEGPTGIGIALASQTWRVSYDSFLPCFDLPGWPVTAVASVNYRDPDGVDQTVTPADYRLDTARNPARLYPAPGSAWPGTEATPSAVWIDYTLGWTDPAAIPADLVDAVALLTAWRYDQREAAVVGTTAAAMPFGVDEILSNYRQGFVG